MDNQQCANCGDIFNGHKRKFCDRQCKTRYQNRKQKGRDLSVLEPKGSVIVLPARPVIQCPVCDTQFIAKMQTRGKSPHRYQARQSYCSRACGLANHSHSPKYLARKAVAIEIDALHKIAANRHSSGKRKQRCMDRHHKRVLREHCRECGSDIVQSSSRMCTRFCDECKEKKRIASKSSEKAIELRNKNRSKRRKNGDEPLGNDRSRAKHYGVEYEPVKRSVVFDMYKWKCADCGVHTPRSAKGKNKDNSPELDHIVPISKGGPHLYSNVQLLCRRCNLNKGDEQSRLI